MNTDFTALTALRDEWQALQPLSAENEARLWKKLRLEWNYHSNHIEGNTLTYGETELLLLHDRTTGNHSHREYLEMKAHDVGVEHVRTLAADKERLLTESDIRDLNKIILKESFWKPAETAEGLATRKEIIPGQYKTTPNNVRLPNGEIFFFASVEDTPPRMGALAAWLRQELESPTLHPVAFAAKLHHDFVLIHPFDDGNGRVARLLVNYVLMRSGYLPLVVRSEDKANYLTALHLADAGDLSALVAYFFQLTEWSLKLGIKAAKGDRIEEPSDVEKEVQLFVREQQARAQGKNPVTREVLDQLFEFSLKPFLEKAEAKLQQLVPLFQKLEVRTYVGRDGATTSTRISFSELHQLGPGVSVVISFIFYGYQGDAVAPFNFETIIEIHFSADHYTVVQNQEVIATRSYDKVILAEEAERLTAQILATAFARIKALSGIKE
ncbi:MAG: Fic family protein [Verrucomicrobiota bacterium]